MEGGQTEKIQSVATALRAASMTLLLMLGWTGLLVLPALRPTSLGAIAVWQMHSRGAAAVWLLRVIAGLTLQVLLFAVLGILAVFLFREVPHERVRRLVVGVAALAVGLAAAGLALWARGLSARGLAVSDLLTAPFGVLFGVLAAQTWRRGLRALALLAVEAAGVALVVCVGAGTLFLGLLERAPSVAEPPPSSTADKRHLVALLRDADPRKVPVGEVHTLQFTQVDIERLLAWALPLIDREARARAAVDLEGEARLTLRGSVLVPRVGQWLNVSASARAGFLQGRPFLHPSHVRIGPLYVPHLLVNALTPALLSAVWNDERVQAIFAGVDEAHVEHGVATIKYRHTEVPRRIAAVLLWGHERSAALHDAVNAQIVALLETLPAVPRGDTRFARAYETAFALARARTARSSAIEENRAAILGLAIVLGSARLSMLAAVDDVDEKLEQKASSLRSDTTVRGRADWTRHFSISSALTAVSSVAPSDAAGLLKEELDADGGSGFSFGDLLADRAGTTFGEVATRDETSAVAIQDRLARGFEVDAFFPPGADLPEKVADAELRSHYGGVGGPLYRKYADEIEERVSACAAYR
jgi:hypothetical protein